MSSRNTDVKDCICSKHCEHKTGVMIPQRDLNGDYVKPEYMICDDCRAVRKYEIE